MTTVNKQWTVDPIPLGDKAQSALAKHTGSRAFIGRSLKYDFKS